ncbi:hypothetical protein ACVW00_001464 [Marmoricola sp. URHA0025 HA25]
MSRPSSLGLVFLPLALVLTACGGSSGGNAAGASTPTTTAASPTPSATPTPTETPSATESAATGAGADVELHVSGAKTIDVSGHGAAAYCAYYFPADEKGVNIHATSGDFAGSGEWSLALQGNDPVSVGLLLAIDGTQFSGNNGDDPATMDQGGTITVSDDVGQAEFDMQLVNIVNHSETVKVTGSVRCN